MPLTFEKVWPDLNTEILRRLGSERYSTWIRNTRPVTLDEDEFAFHFASAHVMEKIESLLKPVLTEAARRITKRNVRIRFSVDSRSFVGADPPPPSMPGRAPVLPEASFETFVAGRGNRLALAAARAFASLARPVFRTLLIHAASGLGKTHLLMAMAREFARRPGVRMLRFTGDQFHRQFAWSHQRGQGNAFLKKCLGADVLLMDDLHLLSGKNESQQALLHVITALVDRGGRAAMTSDRSPRAVEGLSRRFRSRLRLEMEVALERPDAEGAARILRSGAPASVPDAVLEYIARNVPSGPRDQFQCLARLLEAGAPTASAARAVVGEFLNQWSRGLSYEDIARAAAASFGVSVTDIYSERRTRAAAGARQACFYLARKLLRHPFARIGDHFGGRDHATVLQACRKAERHEGGVRDQLLRMEKELGTFSGGA